MSEILRQPRPPYVAVIGEGEPLGPDAHRMLDWAEEIGLDLARAGATVITGGGYIKMPYDPAGLWQFPHRGLVD